MEVRARTARNLVTQSFMSRTRVAAALGTALFLATMLSSPLRAQVGASCSMFDPCRKGFSCQPIIQKCYNSPRREGQPCSAGFGCGPGLRCVAGQQRCVSANTGPTGALEQGAAAVGNAAISAAQAAQQASAEAAREAARMAAEAQARAQAEAARLAAEAQARAQAEAAARAQAEARERARAEAEAARQRAMAEQAAREAQARAEQAARDQAMREQAMRERAMREQAMREQAMREQAMREQAMREQAMREQAMREQAAREQAAREQAAQEQAAQEQAAREQAAREAAAAQAAGQNAAMGEVTNVALGKATEQSGTDFGGESQRAVDGNANGIYNAGSVTHSSLVEGAWWMVDLGGDHLIQSVTVFNRVDCCGERLNADIVVTSTPGWPSNSIVFQQSLGAPSPVLSIPVSAGASPVVGRYVYIVNRGTNYLSLAEVMVMGTPQ